MSYIGDFVVGDTIYTKFTTVTTTGAPTQLAGTPVVSVYEDDSITQITAGITLTVDFDGVTGLNHLTIVASGANGYEAGKQYQAVITTGTVGGTSVVGYVVAEFSIEATSALRPTVAARTLDVSATGESGIDWANIGSPTTAQNLSATNIDVNQVVASVSGAVGSVAAGGITAASIADSAIDRATFAADTGLQTIRSNTAQAGAAGTITLDAGASTVDDFYNSTWIYITSGTGIGQARLIIDYVGATKVATITPNWSTNPDATSTFAILPVNRASLGAWLDVVMNALIVGRVDSNTQAMAAGVIAAATFSVGAIDAAAIATDAITSTELAASAANKIRDTILTDATAFAGANINATILSRATQTSVDNVQTDTDNIQTRLPAALSAGGNMKSDLLEISDDTTAADRLEAFMDGAVVVQVNGVATTTSIPIDGFTSTRNGQFNGRLITILDGSFEQTDITNYVHATQTLTVTALSAAPADNVFIIIH